MIKVYSLGHIRREMIRKPNTLKSMGFSVCESPCGFPPWKFVHVSAQFYDLCTDKQWGQGHGTGPGMGAGS